MAIERRISKNGKKSYRVKIRIKGLPPKTATFQLLSSAEKWETKTRAAMIEGRYFPEAQSQKRTLAELIDLYLENVKVKNPKRLEDVRVHLGWWRDKFGYLMLSDFKSEHILRAQALLGERDTLRKNDEGKPIKMGKATINRYVVSLSTALNFAIRQLKWINHNPVADVDKFKEPQGRTRYLSEDEIKRLIEACKKSENPFLLAIVLVGISTGARKGEIERMRWQDVSVDGKRITLWKTKNGEIRTAYLSGPAFKIIQQFSESKEQNTMLFPSPNNPAKTTDFRHAWEYALKAAGIENFHFHDLRHTCASYMAMNGANAVELAEVLGHKTLAMVRRYAHLSESHVSKITEAMTAKVLGHVEI